MTATAPDLEQVRSQLRELGYLSHRVDRLLLQDALRPGGARGSLGRLALRIGLLGGLPVATVAALALALRNGLFGHDPLGFLPLLLHLAIPSCVLAMVAFAALAGLELLLLARSSTPRVDRLSGALTAAGGLGAALLVAGAVGQAEVALAGPAMVGLAVVAALAGYSALALVRGGLLALAIARTGQAPRHRRARSWVVGLGALVAAGLVIAPAVLAARSPSGPKVDQLPSGPGGPVILLGIDGVLGRELDYLLARGHLPALAALGAAEFRYQRPAGPPAALWTTVGTGVGSNVHEVRAVDGFRPLGVGVPLVVPRPLRWWWEQVMVPVRLVEHRPSLSGRRRAAFLWELVARGGDPVVVVGWWSTFPAASLAGAVVAHGALPLLSAGAEVGITSSPEVLATLRRAETETGGAAARWLEGVADRELAARAAELAVRPDLVVLGAAELLAAEVEPKVVAVYFAGPDVLAGEGLPVREPLAFAELLQAELGLVDRLIARWADSPVTIAVVVDPGRRGESEGRVFLRPQRGACPTAGTSGEEGVIEVGALTSALAREVGLPASHEAPAPPAQCRWPAPPMTVPTWGPPPGGGEADPDAPEYLESLRALGYLG